MYAKGNPKTKKELKLWVLDESKKVCAFQPGGIFPGETDGETVIEGPHYPKPHKWYARVILIEGEIVKVIS